MNSTRILLFLWILVMLLVLSCQQGHENRDLHSNAVFEIDDFNPLSNFNNDTSDIVLMNLDYSDALTNGFVIPSLRQTASGVFIVKFKIRNLSPNPGKFSYKLLYNNESYKFEEIIDGKINPFSSENFYGSWQSSGLNLKTTPIIPSDGNFHEVIDSIQIVGNPRNELKYFTESVNDRWKRNPRVGIYSFHLLILPENSKSFESIPKYVFDIFEPVKETFINPIASIKNADFTRLQDVIYIDSGPKLKISAQPPINNGIYVNSLHFPDVQQIDSSFTSSCGQNEFIYKNAAFEQFVNHVDPSMRFENIPVVRDIMGDDYTKTDYNWDKAFYRKEELISVLPGVAKRPCETVFIDVNGPKIVLKNPGCEQGKWRKESVGIRTRHGFAYGKYRLKCRLTQLLNKDNVWNGLTNAIWLLSQQGSGTWNNRRSCDKEGYMATYWGGDNDKRIPIIDYSEIDFEILKTPPYCPPFNFPPVIKNPVNDRFDIDRWNVSFPEELTSADEMISVACTNWDMACKQPSNFKSGCNEINYKDSKFESHRWTDNYRALTQKKYEKDDELFGNDYYYFEIDWRPTEIIWRIGPSADNMRIVGYMNEEVTSIPNNQMTLIVTQEYHNTKWWPGSPFMQENLPFPSKDLIGEIYELVIE